MNYKKVFIVIVILFSVCCATYFFFQSNTLKQLNEFYITDYDGKTDKKQVLDILHDNYYWLVDGISEKDFKFEYQLDHKVDLHDNNKKLDIKVAKLIGENTVMGFCTFYEHEPGLERIHLLCVDKKFRRMHVAERLVKDVIDTIFKNKKIYGIFLTTRTENVRAQNLYKKFNFVDCTSNNSESQMDGTVVFFLKREDKV